jgi:cell division protein FtsA
MACLDVGSETIKCVVGEMVKKKLNVLAVAEASSNGVKNGIVYNPNLLLQPLRTVIQKCEEIMDLPIKQVIVSVPANDAVFSVVTGTVKVTNEGNMIDGKDVIRVIQKAVKSSKDENLEYITMMPTSFSLDDSRIVKDPKGLTSKGLSVRGVMISTPKQNIYPVLACLERLNIDVVDITISSVGDYFEFKGKEYDSGVTAVVDLGDQKTTMAIFNKGVLTNTKVINLGGQNIDNDISFVYKVAPNVAKELKESFALAHKSMAQSSDIRTVQDNMGRKLDVNQLEISEVVMSRVLEILNLCKKEINSLTKKEISYIIFTGGLTESKDFRLALEEVYGTDAIIGSITEIGVRNNKYSSCLGLLKYYAYTAKLKDKDYSIFSIEEQQKLSGANYDEENNSVIGKLFGYIFNG